MVPIGVGEKPTGPLSLEVSAFDYGVIPALGSVEYALRRARGVQEVKEVLTVRSYSLRLMTGCS